VWKRHWRLNADPFLGPETPYVRSSSHDEALARLVETIESHQRLAVIRARAGLGKSVVIGKALDETRSPTRRVVRVECPVDGPGLLASLAEGLGARIPGEPTRAAAWKALGEGIRLCRWQRLHALLVVDDCQELAEPADRRDLERLANIDPRPATRLTVIQAFRDGPDSDYREMFPARDWRLAIGLWPLTISETARYVETRLAAAGRTDAAFTPRALTRLHDISEGSPRGIDRMATLALMAGALRRLELVTAEVVEGVAGECTHDGRALAS
jgi:type II secretory pathway predicted ATPase ExeA